MQNRSPQSEYESDGIRSMVSKLSELPQEQIELFRDSFSSTPTPPPTNHHNPQLRQPFIDTMNHVPPSQQQPPKQSMSKNQQEFEIIRTGVKEIEINFKGSLRCSKCVEFDEEECTIRLGYGLHQLALCNLCREHKFAIHLCGANIDFLEKHFPENSQVIRTRQKIDEANGVFNRLFGNNQTNTNEQAATSTKSISRSSSAIPLAHKSTARKAAIVSQQLTIMMARKPKIRLRSKKSRKSKPKPISNANVIIEPPPINPTMALASQQESSMTLSSQQESSVTTLPLDDTHSTINLSQPLRRCSFSFSPPPANIMTSTPPTRVSIQTQATGSSSSSLTENKLNEFITMNKSLNERIEDLKQVMEFQNKMMLKGIQRDLSIQTEFLNNFNSQS